MVLIFPAMLGLAVMVVWLGRQVEANATVRAASEAAAQAAARQRTSASARHAAEQQAAAMLAGAGCAGGPKVSIEVGAWRAGGAVTVHVSCAASRAGLELIPAKPTVTSASATATIDPYRSAGR